jgi:hypothetical protein
MSILAGVLLLTSLNLPGDLDMLVLRSGETISVAGPIREDNGRLVFRQAGGALYSLRASEVDVKQTRAAMMAPVVIRVQKPPRPASVDERLKLRVSESERERLLRELETNHAGQPAPDQILLERPPEPPTRAEEQAQNADEWNWRNRARNYEESIRRAKENLGLLEQRAAELRSRIAGFLSLGYKPNQFSYDTAVLQTTLEQIPYAELEVTRAERAYTQFRDDARRQGVMPGWLR